MRSWGVVSPPSALSGTNILMWHCHHAESEKPKVAGEASILHEGPCLRLHSPHHAFSNGVFTWLVRRRVLNLDVLLITPLLEITSRELLGLIRLHVEDENLDRARFRPHVGHVLLKAAKSLRLFLVPVAAHSPRVVITEEVGAWQCASCWSRHTWRKGQAAQWRQTHRGCGPTTWPV